MPYDEDDQYNPGADFRRAQYLGAAIDALFGAMHKPSQSAIDAARKQAVCPTCGGMMYAAQGCANHKGGN
jgi:hypothetical protein